MLTRTPIIDALAMLSRNDFIRAASLGGADASGRADELSDVDLFVIVSPGQIEPGATTIEDALRALSPLRVAYRVPMPSWHGFHQAFYQLEDAPEHLMVDWVIIESGTPHPWLEVERHGRHKVLFDKDGVLIPTHVDRSTIDAACRQRVEEIRSRFALFRHLGPKNAARGLPVDAAHFYHSLALRPMIDMLRITHCPD